MRFTDKQLKDLDRDGFVLIPGLFSQDEVGAMRAETTRLCGVDADYTARERGGDVRAIFRVHEDYGPTQSPEFRALSRTPRLMEPVKQIFGNEDMYVYHTKVNVKPGVTGGIWSWHQDYGRWIQDGVPNPDVYTWLVMLDEAEEINGALYIIPGSHKIGVKEHVNDPGLGALNQYGIARDEIKAILRNSPKPVPMVGPPGTAAIFHANVVHASGHNLSAGDRRQVYVVYNRVSNKPLPIPSPRPDHVCSTNFKPIAMGTDDGIIVAAARRSKTANAA